MFWDRNKLLRSYPQAVDKSLKGMFFNLKCSQIIYIGQDVFGDQNNIGYRRGRKKSYTNLMLKTILKTLFSNKGNKKVKSNGEDLRKGNWAQKQIRDMAKLRGKLILM